MDRRGRVGRNLPAMMTWEENAGGYEGEKKEVQRDEPRARRRLLV